MATLIIHALLCQVTTNDKRLEIYGPAVATAMSSFCLVSIIMTYTAWNSGVTLIPRNLHFIFKWSDINTMKSVALPSILLQAILNWEMTIVLIFSLISEDSSNSTSVSATVSYLALLHMFVQGFQNATVVVTGNLIGSEEEIHGRAMAKMIFAKAVIMTSLMALMTLVFADDIAQIFTHGDQEVKKLTSDNLWPITLVILTAGLLESQIGVL